MMVYLLNLSGNETEKTLSVHVLPTLDKLYDNIYLIKDKDLKQIYNERLNSIYKTFLKK